MPDLVLCRTCRVWHVVEMKPKAEEETPSSINYGTRTLPKKFWTPKREKS